MSILCYIRCPLAGADRLERNLQSLLLAAAFAATLTAAFAAALTATLTATLTAFVRRDQAPMNFPTGADGDGQGMFVGLEGEKNVTRRHAPMIEPQSTLLRIKVRRIPFGDGHEFQPLLCEIEVPRSAVGPRQFAVGLVRRIGVADDPATVERLLIAVLAARAREGPGRRVRCRRGGRATAAVVGDVARGGGRDRRS